MAILIALAQDLHRTSSENTARVGRDSPCAKHTLSSVLMARTTPDCTAQGGSSEFADDMIDAFDELLETATRKPPVPPHSPCSKHRPSSITMALITSNCG